MLSEKNNIDINQTTNEGGTALMIASVYGHTEIVKMLLEKNNIDINQTDKKGLTSLMWASQNGHKEIVKMLEAKVKETQATEIKNEQIRNHDK